jgi:hypothetical protein
MVASLITHEIGADGVVRTLVRMFAQMTVALIREGAPPEAAACRALAVSDLVITGMERHYQTRTMN